MRRQTSTDMPAVLTLEDHRVREFPSILGHHLSRMSAVSAPEQQVSSAVLLPEVATRLVTAIYLGVARRIDVPPEAARKLFLNLAQMRSRGWADANDALASWLSTRDHGLPAAVLEMGRKDGPFFAACDAMLGKRNDEVHDLIAGGRVDASLAADPTFVANARALVDAIEPLRSVPIFWCDHSVPSAGSSVRHFAVWRSSSNDEFRCSPAKTKLRSSIAERVPFLIDASNRVVYLDPLMCVGAAEVALLGWIEHDRQHDTKRARYFGVPEVQLERHEAAFGLKHEVLRDAYSLDVEEREKRTLDSLSVQESAWLLSSKAPSPEQSQATAASSFAASVATGPRAVVVAPAEQSIKGAELTSVWLRRLLPLLPLVAAWIYAGPLVARDAGKPLRAVMLFAFAIASFGSMTLLPAGSRAAQAKTGALLLVSGVLAALMSGKGIVVTHFALLATLTAVAGLAALRGWGALTSDAKARAVGAWIGVAFAQGGALDMALTVFCGRDGRDCSSSGLPGPFCAASCYSLRIGTAFLATIVLVIVALRFPRGGSRWRSAFSAGAAMLVAQRLLEFVWPWDVPSAWLHAALAFGAFHVLTRDVEEEARAAQR